MSENKPSMAQRDALFLSLAGVFITALVLGNVIGTTKFVTLFVIDMPGWLQAITPSIVRDGNIYTMSVPVGVLAYPVTFLATDLISELFGRKKAQLVVWVGFFLNFFMLLVMSVGHWLPNTGGVSGGIQLFEGVYEFMVGNTIASMIAYLTAQTVDVRLFHFWKNLTGGKHLWLRNNASTMFSQLVDSTAILTILYLAGNLGDNVNSVATLIILILNSYLFKFFFALFDTPLFYLGVRFLRHYNEDPTGHSLYDSE
ncbi:MAG: queuosine precursor transporter [Gracilimonas sp.]|uniref:queuosine precursor transporter n=1 Tax=Gracilimonas sp. TaxID=1974203 RepID=UPI00198D38D8|nr:queuosine precursor transporter [Gracilimonas sp.]MBD3614923.1 queuosine precursor transporter [Gracilimonas sp.]